jgi:hypothetical protein
LRQVTRLNSGGQFKPFVYLNSGRAGPVPVYAFPSPQKKDPAVRRDLTALTQFKPELATALAWLIGVLALSIRILLLLSGLLTATLLLAGFLARILVLLTRVLVLLARILVLVRHRDLPG